MRLFTFLLILLLPTFSFGQDAPAIVPVSPEAAALAKMVNYPINHNTGIPNINIPFHTVSVGNLKLPITLNYHAGGFKINERSTRVGLGWSLSCDLQITRSINGVDDLRHFPGQEVGYVYNDLLKSHIVGTGTNSNEYPFYDTSSNTPDYLRWDNTYYMGNGVIDGMPDTFYYKLLNKSGSFYFQKNDSGTGYSIVTVPYDNIKITYNNGGSFTIVDTDGTTYTFGAYSSSLEKTSEHITGWKCNIIKSNNNIDEISFSYTKEENTFKPYKETIEYYNNSNPTDIYAPGDGQYTGYIEAFDHLEEYRNYDFMNSDYAFYQFSSPKFIVNYGIKKGMYLTYMDANNDIAYKYYGGGTNTSFSSISEKCILNQIDISRGAGKVVFDQLSTGQLSRILVYNSNLEIIKTLSLWQSKIDSEDPNNPGNRTIGTYYLDRVEISNGGAAQRYDLLYKNKFDFGDHLKGHDAWGYRNASTTNITYPSPYASDNIEPNLLMPKKEITQNFFDSHFPGNWEYDVNFEIGGDSNWNEQPDEQFMQTGILKSIIYPTGGAVDFDFEANKYLDTNGTYIQGETTSYKSNIPRLCGGLRIRSINYLTLDETSSSIPDFDIKTQKYYRYGELEDGTGILLTTPQKENGETYYGLNSYEQEIVYLEPSGSGACNIVPSACFSEITKETKTTYTPASSLDYTYPDGSPIYYTKVTEYQQDLGVNTGKTVYNYYDTDAFIYDLNTFVSLFTNRIVGTSLKKLKANWYLGAQKNIETYKYDTNKGFILSTRKSFEYNVYDRSDYNGGKTIKVAYAFPKIIKNGPSGAFNAQRVLFYGNDYSAGEYGIPVGKLLLREEKEEVFDDYNGAMITTTNYEYNNDYPIHPSAVITTNSFGDLIRTERKYAYDYSGGIYQNMKDANMFTQLIEETTTNTSTNTEVAKKKIDYAVIANGNNPILPVAVKTTLKSETDTAITYDIYDEFGNILQYTNRTNGYPTSYLWGYSSKYPIAELKNISYNSISSTYKTHGEFENPTSESNLLSALNDLRNTYNTDNSLVSTYTYKRNIGVSTIKDAKGATQYYTYDGLGRLLAHKIKDKDGNSENLVSSNEYYTRPERVLGSSPTYSGAYYNVPQMRTINYDCTTGLPKNHIIPGGTVRHNNSADPYNPRNLTNESVNFFDVENDEVNPFSCPSNQVASIDLLYLSTLNLVDSNGDPTFDFTSVMYVDFIQDNAVVATQRMLINDDLNAYMQGTSQNVTKLQLPEGEYQVSFRVRPNVKFENNLLPIIFFMTDSDNDGHFLDDYNDWKYLENGDSTPIDNNNTMNNRITVENGKSYRIDVHLGSLF